MSFTLPHEVKVKPTQIKMICLFSSSANYLTMPQMHRTTPSGSPDPHPGTFFFFLQNVDGVT